MSDALNTVEQALSVEELDRVYHYIAKFTLSKCYIACDIDGHVYGHHTAPTHQEKGFWKWSSTDVAWFAQVNTNTTNVSLSSTIYPK